jgi:hypothetical protein
MIARKKNRKEDYVVKVKEENSTRRKEYGKSREKVHVLKVGREGMEGKNVDFEEGKKQGRMRMMREKVNCQQS